MRPWDPRGVSGKEQSSLRSEMDLAEVKTMLASHDRNVSRLIEAVGQVTQATVESRGAVADFSKTLSAETRAIRESLAQFSNHVDALEKRVGMLEGGNGRLADVTESRLRAMQQQVSVAVASVVIIVAVVGIIFLMIR